MTYHYLAVASDLQDAFVRTFTLFYSWQSDTPSAIGRAFIRKALDDAASVIRSTRQIAVEIDTDTQGVPGTPAVSETILRKIDACDAVLADLTLVSSTSQGKTAPNPNVLIEYGYALKAKGASHVLLAMNTAFGGPDGLPFDLRHLRHPMAFNVASEAPDAERRERRARFTEKLVIAINAVIDAPRSRDKIAAKARSSPGEALKRLQARQTERVSRGDGLIVRQPQVILEMFPLAALADHRLDLRAVKAARSWFAPSDDAVQFPQVRQNEWLSSDAGEISRQGLNPEHSWATRLLTTGHIERIFAVSRPVQLRVEQTHFGPDLDQMIIEGVRRSGELLAAIGLAGDALISVSLKGCEDLRLVYRGATGTPIGHPYSAFRPTLIADPRMPTGKELRPLLDDVWQAAGWEDGTPSIDDTGTFLKHGED